MSKKYPGGFVTNLGTVGYSVFFDGTGDYLSVPTGTALSLTGDYTVEAWVYVTAQPGASFAAIFSNGDFPATAQVVLALVTSGTGVIPTLYMSNGSGWAVGISGAQQINLNTWTHVAATCSGSTFTVWTNGVSSGTATYSGTRATPAATSVIGRLYVSTDAYYVTGNISNLRVVKGTALYTAAFTPPTQLLNVTNTSLLTCNSPAIVDQSSNNFAITVNGNAAVSTLTPFPVVNPAPTSAFPLTPAPGVWTLDQALQYTQQGVWPTTALNAVEDVFSTYLYTGTGAAQSINNGIGLGNSATNNSSISLNASTPSYLTFSSQVNLSGNFCIQAWVYPTSLTGTRLLFSSTSDNNVQMPRIQENGGIYCFVNGTEITSGATASALQANVWTHLAMTRSGSTFRIFVNGTLYATATYSGTFNIGVLGVFFFNGSLFGTPYAFGGNISNAQIVSGSAIYTTDFTPPQNTLIGGSVLLGAGATPLADTSGTGKTVTQFGSPAASSSGPWSVGGNNGGLVWCKSRTQATSHGLFDTARGVNQRLSSNGTGASANDTSSLTSFNSNGFSLGSDPAGTCNTNADNYVSWTFREQAKFFDVVTYTGTGSVQNIAHNLGSVPGCVITKKTSSTSNWAVYHRGITSSENGAILLNSTDAWVSSSAVWNNTAPTSTNFTVGTADATNINGETYVAYLFAHNAGGFGYSGTDNVISCGSFTTDGSGNATVTLGYEPQWVLIRRTDSVGNWLLMDNMRGMPVTANSSATTGGRLYPNLANADDGFPSVIANATGFTTVPGTINTSAAYVYIAIRRGPMRVPSTGTSVFYPNTVAQTDQPISSNAPFAPDLISTFSRDGENRSSVYDLFTMQDRLRGLGIPSNTFNPSVTAPGLITTSSDAEQASPGTYVQLRADGRNITRGGGWNSASYGNWIYYFFQRAPGFMDVVCYTGNGSTQSVSHNLTVVPELIIVKWRNGGANAYDWRVYQGNLGVTNWGRFTNDPFSAASVPYPWGTPTSSVFNLGDGATWLSINGSGRNYVAYLFASIPGVSKVGSYTGTGTTQVINCGFTAGSRFVMIKRADSTGDWYVWDSARGIVAGNDPYLLLSSNAAEVTNTDFVDTANSGFEISSTAPAAINANGGTFIFLAIA
jgi:hypothetical protein